MNKEVSDSVLCKNSWKSDDKKLSHNYRVCWSFILCSSRLLLAPRSAVPIDSYLLTEKEEANKNARKIWLKMKQINWYITKS